MFRNYFITAYRNFVRNKIFSVINVAGLAIGISAALVIFLIVHYEFSYDTFEKDASRIYRVVLDAKINGMEGHSAGVPAPLSNTMQREMTGLALTVPVMQFQGDATATVSITRKGEHKPVIFKQQPDIIFTNPQYFSLLPYQWIAGSPVTSLQNPFSVVITASIAHKYFPGLSLKDVIGRQINYNHDITATVTGIVKDLNRQTSFTANEFLSFATIAQTHLQSDFMMNVWNDWMAYSQLYIKLEKGISPERADAQLNELYKKYNIQKDKTLGNSITFRLQPLHDVHFNYSYTGVGQRIADRSTLYELMAVAVFLLLLGCFNFINLTTAQATQRAKEIGIKKTLGSSKKAIIFQFLGETFFITIVATILSVIITPLLLKAFQGFTPPGLHFDLLHQPDIIVFLLLLSIVVTFLSGIYPAFILSAYKPVMALKNGPLISGRTRSGNVRKILTVSQFTIAQFFLIVTMIVIKQINYSLHSDMGFNKNAIINFDVPYDSIASHRQLLLTEIKSLPGVKMAATGFLPPAGPGMALANIAYNNGKEKLTPNTQIRWGNPDYIKIYNIQILAGRNVLPSDTIKEFLVNESFARAIGFADPGEAIGKYLEWNGKNIPIVGVMKDFHDMSVRSKISPMVFGGSNGNTFYIALLRNHSNKMLWAKTLTAIKKDYEEIFPGEDFKYEFLDDTIASMYATEQHAAALLRWATALAVLISCLGLAGLVVFTTNIRTKEIGIRKILGASAAQIISLLSKDFMALVGLAFLIAVPVAWIVMHRWLQNFAYHTALSWWIFVISGAAMLFIALIILSFRAGKAALANPVEALRSE